MSPARFACSAAACAGLALVATGLAFAADAVRPDGLRPATVNAKLEARLPGKFIWFDCVTADTYGSKAFYGAVFNWNFHSIGSGTGRYTLIENKGRNIGGMHFRPRDKRRRDGQPLAVAALGRRPGASGALRRNARRQGRRSADDVRRPRHARAFPRQRRRRSFGVLKSETGDPPTPAVTPGEFVWLDLFTRDPKNAAEFYRGLAGYDVTMKETPSQTQRALLSTGGVIRASIITLPKEIQDPGWLPFVHVDDVAATVAEPPRMAARCCSHRVLITSAATSPSSPIRRVASSASSTAPKL
jgi:predicted enzyme related to lactoylglutathione lyase